MVSFMIGSIFVLKRLFLLGRNMEKQETVRHVCTEVCVGLRLSVTSYKSRHSWPGLTPHAARGMRSVIVMKCDTELNDDDCARFAVSCMMHFARFIKVIHYLRDQAAGWYHCAVRQCQRSILFYAPEKYAGLLRYFTRQNRGGFRVITFYQFNQISERTIRKVD